MPIRPRPAKPITGTAIACATIASSSTTAKPAVPLAVLTVYPVPVSSVADDGEGPSPATVLAAAVTVQLAVVAGPVIVIGETQLVLAIKPPTVGGVKFTLNAPAGAGVAVNVIVITPPLSPIEPGDADTDTTGTTTASSSTKLTAAVPVPMLYTPPVAAATTNDTFVGPSGVAVLFAAVAVQVTEVCVAGITIGFVHVVDA
jgi:hypothetical protein